MYIRRTYKDKTADNGYATSDAQQKGQFPTLQEAEDVTQLTGQQVYKTNTDSYLFGLVVFSHPPFALMMSDTQIKLTEHHIPYTGVLIIP